MIEQDIKVNKSDLVYALLSNFATAGINNVGNVVNGKVISIDKKAGICIIDAGLKMEGIVPLKEFFQVYTKESILSFEPEYIINSILHIRNKDDIQKVSNSVIDVSNHDNVSLLESALSDIQDNKHNELKSIVDKIIDRIHFPLHEKDCIISGATVHVYIVSLDSVDGKKILSREKAIKEESFQMLKKKMETNEVVYGITFAKVKGGLLVDFNGFIAFLPGSQIDEANVKDISYLMGTKHQFKVVSVDESIKSVVVSRKAIIDETHKDARELFYNNTQEGSIVFGVVKNITDYGAFIDLGCGLDGLLHLTDISWNKIGHPSEVLTIGQKIEAKVTKCDQMNNKITLSMKHITENSWIQLVKEMETGQIVQGKVTSIMDYGLFVSIAPDVEGLIHVSEITWSNEESQKNLKGYKVGDEVKAMILSIDQDKRRISLSIRMIFDNPYEKFAKSHISNDKNNLIEAIITKIADHCIYVKIENHLDSAINMEELSWSIDQDAILSKYKVGDKINLIYLGSDEKFLKLKFSVKQMYDNPFVNNKIKVGDVVTCIVTDIKNDKICVEIADGIFSHIKRFDLAREKSEQRIDRFVIGNKVDAKVISVSEMSDKLASRRIVLSIKEMEEDSYRKMLEKYGSSDTGASIADILGINLENIKNK